MRLPFSVELIQNPNAQPGSINYYANPSLQGLSSIQVMDKLIEEAGNRGILIMLDMHSLEADGYMQVGSP